MRPKRIKYKDYPYSLTVRMKVTDFRRVRCLDGTMKAHVRRNKKVVILHVFFKTKELMMHYYNKALKTLKLNMKPL